MAADRLIADKAVDADTRVLEPLARAGKSTVIPPRPNRRTPRDFDRHLYKERHLIENFFCKLNSSARSPRATTKPRGISSPLSISPQLSFGSIDDRP
jgi:transposase